MPSSFDLLILPLARSVGQELPSVPGLMVATPPRRPARGRDRDQLLLFLSLSGGAPLEIEQMEQLLTTLAGTYYRSPGTVTTAQRVVANSLNQYLLERNLRNASSGSQAVGMLAQVILRGERLSLALSGKIHAILSAGGETKDLYDPQLAGRGLGLTRMTVVRYSQHDLQASDALVLTAEIPSGWSPEVFSGTQGQGPESLRRRLLGQAGADLHAALLHAQTGTGVLRLLRPVRPARPQPSTVETPSRVDLQPSAATPSGPTPDSGPSVDQPAPAETIQTWSEAEIGPEELASPEELVSPEEQASSEEMESDYQATRPAQSAGPLPATPPVEPVDEESFSPFDPSTAVPPELSVTPSVAETWPTLTRTPPPAPPPDSRRDRPGLTRQRGPAQRKPKDGAQSARSLQPSPFMLALATSGKAVKNAGSQLLHLLATLLRRMLPDEGIFTLPTSTMAFVAIAVPLVMVVSASVVYFQRGRAAQYQVYFDQAQETARQAQANPDPDQARQAWETTLAYLDQAEFYQNTPDSQALRIQAQTTVDEMDSIQRLNFQLAIVDGLDENSLITRMVATDSDLYLLDAKSGGVLRATMTNSGYRLDPTFECRPGPYAGMIVGAIVDITPLPKGNDMKAVLLGVDANGSLFYCIPGEAPLAATLTPPDTGWGPPQGLVFNTDDLYILDPRMNAVWIYRRMEISSQPRLFFGEQVPPMQDVIDMAINLDDLYLLHTDGHLTTCVFSGLLASPTRCEDPANFTDQRPGRESGPLIEDGHFTEILFIPPPDPSIYLLEPNSHAIYHFSVRLTFQRQFRPQTSLGSSPATAFAISRGSRTTFLALGNQVYAAPLP